MKRRPFSPAAISSTAILSGTILSAMLVVSCSAPPKQRTGLPAHQRPSAADVPGEITVRISGIPKVEGQLFVELYDEQTYFQYDKVLNERIVPVDALSMTVTLSQVPAGRYIAVASHDANSNHDLDTGLFGKPTEVYGFSRDARGRFGPPDFDDGAFEFDGSRAEIVLDMR